MCRVAAGLCGPARTADVQGVTTLPWAGRLLPATLTRAATRIALRSQPLPVPTVDVPAGWERLGFDDTVDDDPLGWLGFESTGRSDEPRWRWDRPAYWPSGEESPGRHRAA